jgi:hypothetical protein
MKTHHARAFVRTQLFFGLLALTGCSAMQAHHNDEMDRIISSGKYASAAALAESRLGYKNGADGALPTVIFVPANVLDHLDAAEAWQLSGNVERSVEHFDAAEQALRDVETEGGLSQGAQQVAAVVANDKAIDYRPSPAEAILINYHKAVDFWKLGKIDDVRIELNRADDRTRRAVERYDSEIAKASAEAASKRSDQTYDNPKVRGTVDRYYPEMAQWTPYREFIVPPATYLQALFLSRSNESSDRAKGQALYQRVAGLIDENPTVQTEVQESASGRVCPHDDCVWVLVEHGLGPVLIEKRFDLPVFTPTGLISVSMALPSLKSRTTSDLVPFRLISNGASVDMPPMASMDRVLQVEFSKRFPGIVTRAAVSTTVKAVAQAVVNKQAADHLGPYGQLFSIGTSLLSSAVTSADTRMWRTMPGRFALQRLQRTPDMKLSLETPTGPMEIALPESGSSLVYIQQPISSAPPHIDVLPL